MTFFGNVFNDPSSPWYYVIGVLFLVLIFGALAAYIILSKKKKSSADGTESSQENENGEVVGQKEAQEQTETDIPQDNTKNNK